MILPPYELLRYRDRDSELLSDSEEVYAALTTLNVEDAREGVLIDSDTAYAIRLAREESILQRQLHVDHALAANLQDADSDEDFDKGIRAQYARHRFRRDRSEEQLPTVVGNNLSRASVTLNATSRFIRPMKSISWLGNLVSRCSSWHKAGAKKEDVAQKGITATAESSRAHERRLTGHDCVICGDAIRGTEIRAPCSHYYDKSCIIELFKAATRDETLYPPRCCRQQIPLSSVRSLLTADAIELFNEKAAEFRTLNRVYCSNPRCSRFLGPQQESPKPSAYHLFKCSAPDCKTETCACCKARVESHTKSSHVCRKDVDAHDVLALGERARWARCPGCEALIELNLGCFHMTCRCKTEFCYSCGARWKTCRCPQWEERRLLAAAEARVDIRLGLPPVRRGEGIRGRARAPRHVLFPVPRPVFRLPQEEIEDEYPTTHNIQQEQTLSTHEPEPVPANLPHNTDQSRQSSGHVGDDVASSATAKQRQNTKLFALSRRKHSPSHVDISSWRRQLPVASSSKLPASSLAGPIKSLNWKKQEQSVASATTSHSREAKGSAVEDVWKEIEELIERPPTAWKHDIDTWRADVRRASTASTTSDIIVNPNGKGKEPETRTRWQLVREAMEHLRGHHECDHAHWSYRKGSGNCDTCHYHLPFYLYRCTGCDMLACKRCKQNRL